MTDANVVLGSMPAAPLADGQISVAADLAQEAVASVAEPLGLTLLEAAEGIHRIANARMTRALRAVSSERGRDPRDFALLAYGGSGPLHAAALADELGIATVLVPPLAGLFSSLGLLFARPELHEARSCQLDARTAAPAAVEAILAGLERRLEGALAGWEEVEWKRSAELRYEGQSWEIEVALTPGPVTEASLRELLGRFEEEHERLYGVRGRPGSPVQLRTLRLAALGPAAPVETIVPAAPGRRGAATARLAQLDGKLREVPVCGRASVGARRVSGPLLVDEYDTTVVVPPGWSVRRNGPTETLVLERSSDGG